MGSFDLYLDASSSFGTDAPTLEILVDGQVVSSLSITAGFGPVTLTFGYAGNYPSSVSFRFHDTSLETGRSVTLNEVRINNTPVQNSSLSLLAIQQGQTSQLNVAAEKKLFWHCAG